MSNPVFSPEFFEEVLSPEWTGRERFQGASGFSFDTRTLESGDVFVALQTGARDGHDFLEKAAEAGASCALVSNVRPKLSLPQMQVDDTLAALQKLGAAWRKRWGGRVIGVTGSCGKTSTKELLGLLLGREETHVSPGNLNNHIGVPLSLLLLRDHHKRAVIEAGINQGGEMKMLASLIEPQVGIVTTIGPAHLEKLGSLEGIASEKVQLPSAASESVFLGSACSEYQAFTHATLARPNWLIPDARPGPFGFEGKVWRIRVNSEEARLCPDGGQGEPFVFSSKSATPGMIENMGLAILVAREEGVSDELLSQRMASWKPASQRGEILKFVDREVYADHYNANPASFADAVSFFSRRYPSPPRCWVIGAMEELGAETAVWHRKLAAALPVESGDRVFLIGPSAAEMVPILKRKISPEDVRLAETAEEVAEEVAQSQGTVFLKGSRKHALEKILDSLGSDG